MDPRPNSDEQESLLCTWEDVVTVNPGSNSKQNGFCVPVLALGNRRSDVKQLPVLTVPLNGRPEEGPLNLLARIHLSRVHYMLLTVAQGTVSRSQYSAK